MNCVGFLDSGSQRSYTVPSVVACLGLRTLARSTLSVHGLGKTSLNCDSMTVEIGIKLKDGSTRVFTANTLPSISNRGLIAASVSPDLQHTSTEVVEPSVLLGNNIFWDLCSSDITCQLPNGLTVVKSKLGDIVTGRGTFDGRNSYPVSCETTTMATTECYEQLWQLEAIGITDDPLVQDDEVAEAIFRKNATWKGDHYEVPFLWNTESPVLPHNLALCRKRLIPLYNRLRKDPEKLRGYDKLVKSQLPDIIEEAPDIDTTSTEGYLCHHLPHREVVKDGKCRIVMDASSKEQKRSNSLNDCQFRGPSRLPDVARVTIRSRVPKICIWRDLEKAFLKLGLAEKDRNVTRFLWLKDITKPPSLDNIIVYRFRKVLFGMKCSPALLRMTIEHHLKRDGSAMALDILKNIYVDDVCQPAETTEEGIDRYHKSKDLFVAAGMNLRDLNTDGRLSSRHRFKKSSMQS